ncbi:tRNA-splicing endonuclease subunit Sen15 [Ceraceosorus bombacis]|uniref:tRNA-splicing endonuclease subunit Sen15 n=1 Tax=Ceraceosorus bombacis TaxID=401625 RepID=A0A0P1BF32_9BASI|nr:tRNA-splicing endonuclease subunit Sen15 [Ceraceosorus bombacis]
MARVVDGDASKEQDSSAPLRAHPHLHPQLPPSRQSLPDELLRLARAHPDQAAPLVRTWEDLLFVGKWKHLRPIDLNATAGAAAAGATSTSHHARSLAALVGLRAEQNVQEVVLPCHVHHEWSAEDFIHIFASTPHLSASPSTSDAQASAAQSHHDDDDDDDDDDDEESKREDEVPRIAQEYFLLAVLSNDSTVVYYKLARGLVKPVN